MTRIQLIFNALLFAQLVCAQSVDTLSPKPLSEVVVTAFKEEPAFLTPLNILPIRIDSLTTYGNYNLTDLLTRFPGVTMLSTGVAIAKPVIRGLYGNRVVVLLSGLKFDNQQWQEEHGLGLSDFGLEKVELIKGPLSVLYGTEAIGGLINLIEEKKPAQVGTETDCSIKLNSNTLGGLLQAGSKKNLGQTWYGWRVGVENHADYSDGHHDRVLNSRFDGYYVKGLYGFQKKSWTSENHLLSSFNRFGFIFSDLYTFLEPDARWSRSLGNKPAHFVLLNCLSSENKFYFRDLAKLTVQAGVQSNRRLENEGGGKISLDMHLLTLQYLAKWEKELSPGHRLIISNLGSFEDNTNYGSRKIVPDANLQESNVSLYYEIESPQHIVFENGIGLGEKWIRTFFTPTVNGPEKEIEPFHKTQFYWTAFTGISYFPRQHINLKFNLASGVRIPNLAELSSDGLHEGVFTYEIGNPTLKNEQNFSANGLVNFTFGSTAISLTPFYTFFKNYVYLAPTDEEWFGFPIYRYKQQDAHQYGLECSGTYVINAHFTLQLDYAGMKSQTEDGQYTPYTPAQKIKPSLSYTTTKKRDHHLSAFVEGEYLADQHDIYPGEIATPSYFLLHAGLTIRFSGHANYTLGVTGHNLLNERYFDHLSRLKYFGLNNIGRNLTLFAKASIGRTEKK